MKYPRILLVCLGLLAALWTGAVQALPTVDQVQAAVQRGDYGDAEKMMREVVAARPNGARGHYVLAEILAHQRQFNEAAEHTRRARALDPALKFTDPAKFKAFEQLLQREQAAAAKPAAPTPLEATAPPPPQQRAAPAQAAESPGLGVPVWLLVAGAIVFVALAASWMRRRTTVPAPQPAMAGGYGMGGGYGPGMAPQPGPMAGGGGPGLMGVGLAAAGGVAAGMLAERMLRGGSEERSLPPDHASAGGAGGLIPGSFGDGGADDLAQELTRRDIDFGSGDGWGDGDAGGGSDDW